MKIRRSYSELIKLESFQERLEYLKLDGRISDRTFGADRYLNQILYTDKEWRNVRSRIILRDNGCDLGVSDYEIPDVIIVHHINPISVDDILRRNPEVFNEDNLITSSRRTHNIIHYKSNAEAYEHPVERYENDTCPWKKGANP